MKHFLHFKRAMSVLLLALLMPLTTSAQGSFTVFDGTNTSQLVPAYIFYFDQYAKSQVIYPAESLTEMNGQTITEIKFYTNSTEVPYTTTCDADVYLKEVSYADLDAFVSKEDATIVYSDKLSIVATDGGGEMTIQLEEPFIYNGGNLIIGIENTAKGEYKGIAFYGISYGSETGISIAGFDDDNPDEISPSNRAFRPKTTFSYRPYDPDFLYKPKKLTLDQCGANEATVSWTSTETNFDIMVNGTVTENVSNPYTITGLQMATNYEVKVRARRENNTSDWSNPLTFTTLLSDDLCTMRLDLTDSYGDGWNGASLKVVDVLTGTVITQVANESSVGLGPMTVYASVPDLREIKFVWQSGNYDSECSWIIYDTSGDILFSGNWPNNSDHSGSVLGTYTVNCNAVPRPTDIHASSITNNSAVVSWTQQGDVASWIVAYKADGDADFTEVTANTNPYTLTGLTQETTYTVKVRPVMVGGTIKWTDEITFTTQSLVSKPTEVNITNINWNAAQVNWNGFADSYDIRYKTGLAGGTMTTDFDDSDFDGWTTIDADGDGWDWQLFSTTTYLTSAPGAGNGYNGSSDHVASGSYRNIGSSGEILHPDNYLVSPMITFGGTISFWACAQDANYPEEHFGVAVSTTVNDIPDAFTTIWENDMTAAKQRKAPMKTGPRKAKGNWHYYEIDLSGFTGTGYVAIRHFNCEDKFLLDVDDITIVQPENNNPWITVENVTGNSYVITELEQTTAYTVEVRSNYGTDLHSNWTKDVVFTTAARYPAPTNLQADEVAPIYAVLSWTPGENSQTTWDVAYKTLTDDDYTIVTVTDNPYTLSGLQSDTDYLVKVRGNYGLDGVGAWSNNLFFTTPFNNPVPTNMEVEPLFTSANISWTGYGENYDVRYRTAAGIIPVFSEDWERGDMSDWTKVDCNDNSKCINSFAHNGSYCFSFYYNSTPPQYLISPVVSGVTDGMKLQFYYKNTDPNYDETFQIGFSSTTNNIDAFSFGDELTASGAEWLFYNEDIPAGTQYICWKLNSYDCFRLLIDDIVVGTPYEAGEWTTINTENTSTEITNLTASTIYDYQIRSIKGASTSDWTDMDQFTTLSDNIKIFVTDGNWNDDDNWLPVGVPATTNDVLVRADAIIPDGVIADVNNITVESGSITIKDGGQLKSISDNVPVVLEKDIAAEQFYLITTSIKENITPDNVPNCITGDYNLYRFRYDNLDEWRNYKDADFVFELGNGYLYSKGDNVTLQFAGTTFASKDNVLLYTCNYSDTSDYFNGWLLVGNIYTCNATLTYVDDSQNLLDVTFYKMNDEGTAYEMYETAVVLKPGEAAFIQINQTGNVVFNSETSITPTSLGESTIPVLPEIDINDDSNQDATPVVALADDADNTDVLDALNGKTGAHVALVGRKLWRDGAWNTLCLPFDLQIASSLLADAEEIRTLNSASYNPETLVLTLNFNDPVDTADPAATISTGVPFIVKWPNTNDFIESPVFQYVTVSNAEPVNTVIEGVISFIGTYKPVNFTDGDRSILFMGENSTLYYPAYDAYVNAFRAYFKLADGLSAGDTNSGIKGVVVNFGDGDSTSIHNLQFTIYNSDSWYDLSGRKLNGKPTAPGIYLNNGHKVSIK